jgi:hypothetical protein
MQVKRKAIMAEQGGTHLWTIAILVHGDLQFQLFISPNFDDVADSTLNLLGRQSLLGVALGIVNSAILAHQS